MKKKILVSIAIIGLVTLFFFLRGPYVSDTLKGVILPELTAALGKEVAVSRISLNLFPLFLEARELRVLDEGEEVLSAPRIKAYLGLTGLLKKELVLRRIGIHQPRIKSDIAQLEEIVAHVKKYIEEESTTSLTVKVKSVVLDDGTYALAYRDGSLQGSGWGGEVLINDRGNGAAKGPVIQRVNFGVKEFVSSFKGWPDMRGSVKAVCTIRDNTLDLKALTISVFGSTVDAEGTYSPGKGAFNLRMAVLMESLKRVFGLKKEGEGTVSAQGRLTLTPQGIPDILNAAIDIDLQGSLFIQTLMEALKVQERVEGILEFKGSVKGSLRAPVGLAQAHLKKGNLFDVAVDDMKCSVAYRDGLFRFENGKGALYNGTAEADVTLSIFGETVYSLAIRFSDVDSQPLFGLIGWDPGLPAGKVKGSLSTAGTEFNPSGTFLYENAATGKDVLGRVKRSEGTYSLTGSILRLSDVKIATGSSSAEASGTVDIERSLLSLAVRGSASDIRDVTLPYLNLLTGSGEFSGVLSGTFEDPILEGKVRFGAAAYGDFVLGDIVSELRYGKSLLEVKALSARAVAGGTEADQERREHAASITVKGRVAFPDAQELFDFKRPLYNLSVGMRNADIETALRVVYETALRFHPRGRFSSDFTITGPGPEPLFKGAVGTADAVVDMVKVDSASGSFAYDYKDLAIADLLIKIGDSAIAGKGSISSDDRYGFSVTKGRVFLKDIMVKGAPPEASVTFKASGSGSFDDPALEVDGVVKGGKVKDVEIGGGTIKALIRDKVLTLEARLLDDRVTLNGEARITEELPWTARMDVRSARLDFILASLLKEVPEDLLINVKGHADMSGDRRHFFSRAVINQLTMTLYGNSFSNDSEFHVEIKDKKVSFPDIRMRSGTTSFRVAGVVDVMHSYDITMEGNSNLAPIKGFSRRIDTIRGDGSFVFSITGAWNEPRVNGGITVSNGVFGLKEMPQRISSINGYLFMDEDRVVIQRLNGKVGGGDVEMSGISYLKGLKLKRFYLDAVLHNIGTNISREFPVNFNGNLLYRGTLDDQTISGELGINRARYRERVEWKSWMLRAKAKDRPRGELGALERAGLNVRIYGSDLIEVDNNVAQAPLKVEMLLKGTVARPVLFGRVESKGGKVYFRNNEFRVIHASADFHDPQKLDPVIDVVAETSIAGYLIRLNLEGQMEHFNLALASNPPLDQMDILSLLATGKLGGEMKGFESGIGAGAATSFLTGKVQDVFEERVRGITGLDRIEVDPYVSKTTGVLSPRVTLSKRLGDSLYVTYSTAVGSTEFNVVKVEYFLTKSVSLVGVRDERGSIGGDVKFRFEFK